MLRKRPWFSGKVNCLGETPAGFEKTVKRKVGLSRFVWMDFLHREKISLKPVRRENSLLLSKAAGEEEGSCISWVN